MEQEQQPARQEVDLATFSERVVAFSVDYALFTAGYFVTLKLAFPGFPVRINPHGMTWALLWIALFLAYHAVLSAGGRSSLGKRLVGLRVVNLGGDPLPPGLAALRSVAYLLSSLLGLGFLWMHFNRARQTWHDMLVGSVVADLRQRTPGAERLMRAAACACLLVFAGTWTWEFFLASRYYRIMTVAYSHVGVREIAQLQQLHRLQRGRYADSILQLSEVSIDPKGFLRDMAILFDPETGVQIRPTADGYVVEGRSADIEKTPIRYVYPEK